MIQAREMTKGLEGRDSTQAKSMELWVASLKCRFKMLTFIDCGRLVATTVDVGKRLLGSFWVKQEEQRQWQQGKESSDRFYRY